MGFTDWGYDATSKAQIYTDGAVPTAATTGIAVIIWVGQWKDFFGLPAIDGIHFHEKLWHLIEALPQLHPATTLLALASVVLVTYSARFRWIIHVPGPLVAMLFATVLQSIFKFEGVATIGSAFGGIPQQLPSFSPPAISASRVVELIGPAFTIAMLGAIESLLSAVVADGMAGTKHDSNQELIGQGVANMISPLLGGFAATGAIARTATSIRNGGSSPVAGITHALTLVLIILFLAPLAVNIPLAALAAILFVVAYNMSEIPHFAKMVRRAPRADVAILLITFLLTVFTDLVVAVNIGVILASFQFLRRMAASVEVQHFTEHQLSAELAHLKLNKLPAGVLVYAIEGPFFFGAVENFERVLVQTHTEPRILVLRLRWMPFLDITGLQTLEEVISKLHKRGVRVMLCEANPLVQGKLIKAGILDAMDVDDSQDTFAAAITRCIALTGAEADFDHKKPAIRNVHAENLLKISRDYFIGKKNDEWNQ